MTQHVLTMTLMRTVIALSATVGSVDSENELCNPHSN